MWKLACAYDRKGDWASMIVAAQRAAELAPDHANYWFKTGYAMVKQAEAGHPEFYQSAKAPFERCIRADPNYAEAYYFLGEARLWTDDEQGAIEAYSQAIEHDSKVAYFYPPLADLYIDLKLYREAEQVLNDGLSAITVSDSTSGQLYAMYLMQFRIAQAADDKPNMVRAMEKAYEVGGNAHPEIAFNLGSTYAVMKPPRKADAVRLLGLFYKLACRGAGAAKFALQCEEANELIQRLGQ